MAGSMNKGMLTVVSLFSGIGGFDLAARNLGMKTVLACEIDPQARSVFRHHFPETPIIHDIKKIRRRDLEAIGHVDILCAGFPCQDLSVAGQRRGLAGKRSGLFHRIMRLITKFGAPGLRPRWIVIENVPGLLSSNGGRDMGTVLTELEKRGYGWAYRVLDAQYFGVPQRRRRVFIIGCLGGWEGPAKVLFERESLFGNPPTRGKAGARVAALTQSGVGTCGADDNQAQAGHLVAFGGNNTAGEIDVAACLNACKTGSGRQDFESETFIAHTLRGGKTGWCGSEDGTGRGTPIVPIAFPPTQDPISGEVCPAQGRLPNAVAFTQNQEGKVLLPETINPWDHQTKRIHAGAVAPTLAGSDGKGGQRTPYHLLGAMQVRRLMVIECERLMGLRDDWTRWGVDDNGKQVEIADSPRYRMCGNGVERNTAQWLMGRIQAVECGIELPIVGANVTLAVKAADVA